MFLFSLFFYRWYYFRIDLKLEKNTRSFLKTKQDRNQNEIFVYLFWLKMFIDNKYLSKKLLRDLRLNNNYFVLFP